MAILNVTETQAGEYLLYIQSEAANYTVLFTVSIPSKSSSLLGAPASHGGASALGTPAPHGDTSGCSSTPRGHLETGCSSIPQGRLGTEYFSTPQGHLGTGCSSIPQDLLGTGYSSTPWECPRTHCIFPSLLGSPNSDTQRLLNTEL